MRSTGFVIVSILVHGMAVAAIALSPQQITEFTKGQTVEVNIGTPAEQPGVAEAPKQAATVPAATPAPAPAPVVEPAPALAPAPAPTPAPAPVAKKAPVQHKSRPAVKAVASTALPPKQQPPEKLDPVIDEQADVPVAAPVAKEEAAPAPTPAPAQEEAAPKFVPVKEKVAAGPVDQETEAASNDIKKSGDPAPAPVSVNEAAAPVGDLGKGGATQAGAVEFTDLKQMNGNRAPLYPLAARREKRQGEVELLYRVTKQGSVTDVTIAKSSGSEDLDAEAVRAISKFHFVPGQEGWAKHPVNFTLKGETAALPSRLRTKVGSQE